MKNTIPLVLILLALGTTSCSIFGKKSSGTTKVVRPKYHNVWPTNQYLVDIPVGARHIRLFERKRTQTVRMR